MKLRLCVGTEISRHMHGARAYAVSVTPVTPINPSFGMQWVLGSDAAKAAKVRPLGLAGGSTG